LAKNDNEKLHVFDENDLYFATKKIKKSNSSGRSAHLLRWPQ